MKSDPKCRQCGESNLEKMMIDRNRTRRKTLCKSCHNKNTILRGKKNKEVYIAYKGGGCEICGYTKSISALEFHHRDPTQKDIRFQSIRYWGLEKAKAELDKCMLLCSNCHREEHDRILILKLGA